MFMKKIPMSSMICHWTRKTISNKLILKLPMNLESHKFKYKLSKEEQPNLKSKHAVANNNKHGLANNKNHAVPKKQQRPNKLIKNGKLFSNNK